MGVCFFIRDITFAFPRSVILYSGFVYFILLTLWHVLIFKIQRKIVGIKKVTIIGDGCLELSEAITSKLKKNYQIVSQCNFDELSFESKIEKVDTVFLSANIPESTRVKILSICTKEKKEIFFVPQYSDLRIMSSNFYKTDDIPTFRLRNIEFSEEQNFLKRTLDLLLSSIAIVILFPLCIVIALLVKHDGGTIFYSQERLTKGRKIFKILKFRTMIPDAEKVSGPVLAGENDPRITKLGKFMRATRIDEIPQLINIFKGEMSIVGPRPERPFFVEQFEKENFEYSLRFNVKAGLTGLAQVEGKYNTTMENKLRYDLYYTSNYSVWNDLLIIIQTIKVLFMKSSTEGVVDNKK
ncbi:sugar transferase [Bacteroidia bacterium]|nr:sugar transferase [Bacteroidia bacterium]GHV09103.1 sugar transferase [Bacteroidia bacterium]